MVMWISDHLIKCCLVLCICIYFVQSQNTNVFNNEINSSNDNSNNLDISDPGMDIDCGIPIYVTPFTNVHEIYNVNETFDLFAKLGFEVIPLEVNRDQLLRFVHFNGTHHGVYPPFGLQGPRQPGCRNCGIGGINARRVVTIYMALLGQRTEGDIDWLCDGVLVNRLWILTAAHCFAGQKRPNMVRLGEYDFSNPTDLPDESPIDYNISAIVPYPEYTYPAAYHDLALVKLPKETPYFRIDIQPLCLPWGSESKVSHSDSVLTLTGWGATTFGGPHSAIIQEVNITVFPFTVCEESYSQLFDFLTKWPQGMDNSTVLCAGDPNGGRDACQGDSGGPVVYQQETNNLFTLAGIVSTGYGCGLKEYPGIYVPINQPKYLAWIKRVAFS